MNIDNATLSVLDVVSAAICFILVWFMTKPYRYTGEGKYISLPLAFSLLAASFAMGGTLYFEPQTFIDVIRWFQLFTQSYAFAFLAVTYYFSKKGKEATKLWLGIIYATIFSVIAISLIIIFVPKISALPNFNMVNESMRIFNIVCLSYIALHTLRGYVSKPDPKTIWIPFGFLLIDFSQYSFLIWSIDASFTAFVGAHFLRLAGLLIFLTVAYQTFYTLSEGSGERELNEKDPSQR